MTSPVLGDGTLTFTPGISERSAGVSTFVHSGIKNLDTKTTAAATTLATKRYDAFGSVENMAGTWGTAPFSYGGAFGYQEDEDYGLKLLVTVTTTETIRSKKLCYCTYPDAIPCSSG